MNVDIIRTLQHRLRVKRPLPRRAAGDEARDRRDWAAAEREYAAHLARVPDDQAIWVQYGHSLKEQGKQKDAETAYRHAIKLHPNDADAHLQLGHVLKLLGRSGEAQREYAYSMELKPSQAAFEELINPDAVRLATPAPPVFAKHSADTIYLEIDDLLDYLKAHRTVSGIQRVQVGVITHAMAEMAQGRGSYCLVRTDKRRQELVQVATRDIAVILDYLKQSDVTKENLLKLVDFAERRASLIKPAQGQVYLVLGAFWGFGSNMARYLQLKQAGVKVGVYVYDLIPVTHPEYCESGLVSDFTLALGDGLYVFDFILTISEYVANSVRAFVARHELHPVPVRAVPLAHRIHDSPVVLSASAEANLWSGPIAKLKDRQFVLVVCTIEPRKNHAYLHAVWKALVEEGLDPPDLVFVGRFGWRVNDFHNMLVDTGFLGGRVHLLHDLSDMDLELLYRSCLFTAFPSIVEGWGLPVGESLMHGRAVIASSTSSVPEVGGAFVDYIDPWNVTGGIEVFKRMLFDVEYREERTRNVRENFVARTWDDVGKDLLTQLETLRQQSGGAPIAPPLLRAGELLVPGAMSREKRAPANYAQRALRLVLAEGWYPLEPFGAWMRGHHGVLQFKADCAPGTRVILYLRLVGAPWSSSHIVEIQVGQQPATPIPATFPEPVRGTGTSAAVKPGAEFFCIASGDVDADGAVLVSIRVHGEDVLTNTGRPADDERVFLIGLSSLAYAHASDTELRADLSERFLRER